MSTEGQTLQLANEQFVNSSIQSFGTFLSARLELISQLTPVWLSGEARRRRVHADEILAELLERHLSGLRFSDAAAIQNPASYWHASFVDIWQQYALEDDEHIQELLART